MFIKEKQNGLIFEYIGGFEFFKLDFMSKVIVKG